MNRREFLRSSAATGAAVALGTGLTAEAAPKPRIVVARGGGAPDSNEGALARMKAALDKWGGFADLVRKKHPFFMQGYDFIGNIELMGK